MVGGAPSIPNRRLQMATRERKRLLELVRTLVISANALARSTVLCFQGDAGLGATKSVCVKKKQHNKKPERASEAEDRT